MRAAIAIESFRAGPGGVEAAAFALARELGARGVDLTVLCRESPGPAPASVRVQPLGGPAFWQVLRVLEFSRRAARAARAGGFDVVQAYSRTRHQDIYRTGGGSHEGYLRTRGGGRVRLRDRLSPRHAVLLALEAAVFRDPRQVFICNSKLVAVELTQLHGISPERLRVIHNGVDVERFHPRARAVEGAQLRKELGLAGPIALFVGSGFERKGLAEAIAGLRAAPRDAQLVVVGAGEPRPYQRQAAALGLGARVHFLGVRLDVARLYAAADLFVLPTHYDAFANACLEAMAAGVPPATTPFAGAAELIEPGVSGFVCERDFSPAFAALARPAELAALGAAARRRAEQLSWAAHADAVLALWNEVAARR